MKFKFISVLIFIIIAGCNGNNSTDITVSESNSMIGSWTSNCYQIHDDPENIWSISEYHITESDFSYSYAHYSDSSCTTPYSGNQNLWQGCSGTYTQLRMVTTTSGTEANWLEITCNISPPLQNDIVAEYGIYINSDELYPVIEDSGFYYVSITAHYKQ